MNIKIAKLMAKMVVSLCLLVSMPSLASLDINALGSDATESPRLLSLTGTLDYEQVDYLNRLNITEPAVDGFVRGYRVGRLNAKSQGMSTDAFDFYILIAAALKEFGVGQVHFKNAFNHSFMNMVRVGLDSAEMLNEGDTNNERDLFVPTVPENFDKYEYYPSLVFGRLEHLFGRMNIGYRQDEIQMQPISWSFGRTTETLDMIQQSPIDKLGDLVERTTGKKSLLQSSLGGNSNFFRGASNILGQESYFDAASQWLANRGIVAGAGGALILASNLSNPLESYQTVFNGQFYAAADLHRAMGIKGLKVGLALDLFEDIGIAPIQLFDPNKGNIAPKLLSHAKSVSARQRSLSTNYRFSATRNAPYLQVNYRHLVQQGEVSELFGIGLGVTSTNGVTLQLGCNSGSNTNTVGSVSLMLSL